MMMSSNIFGWLSRSSAARKEPARTPPDTRIYAIGDIHGRADLLESIQQRIAIDQNNASVECLEIYLGDYIDRGPASKEVIDLLLKNNPASTPRIFLKGNHEATLLDFLEEPETLESWRGFGGLETIHSYGVNVRGLYEMKNYKMPQAEFLKKLPEKHKNFYHDLRLSETLGDYFFVHAGVKPKIALDLQEEKDLIWIRGEFLNSRADHGKVIIHGHTPVDAPEIWPNRINIDTGAYLTNKLTCLVLEGEERRFL